MSGMRADFHLTGEQRATRDLARQLAREGIAPLAAGGDETESYPGEQLARPRAPGPTGGHTPPAPARPHRARGGRAPRAAGVDETESSPGEQLARLGAQGLMGVYIPEAWG